MHLFDKLLNEPARRQTLQQWLLSAKTKTKLQQAHRRHRQIAVRDLFRRQLEASSCAAPSVPTGLAKELAEAFDWLSQGYANPLVTPASKNPGSRTPPPLKRCQLTAVVYLELAHKTIIDDKTPMKTITEAFGVRRPAVRLWKRQLKSELPQALAAIKGHAELRITSKLGEDAIAYRSWRKRRDFTTSLAAWPRHIRGMHANRSIG
jgi:hypothetical protein